MASRLDDIRAAYDTLIEPRDPDDTMAVDYILSLVTAKFLPGLQARITEPVWGYLIGGSGSGKSELVRPFSNWDSRIYRADAITSKAIVSGYTGEHGKANFSQLDHMNGKVLLFSDFTTQVTQDSRDVVELFGLLRKAFDGQLEKIYGNEAGRQGGRTDFGMLCCCTPEAIDRYADMNQTLGERFVTFRICRAGPRSILEELAWVERAERKQNAGGTTKAEKRAMIEGLVIKELEALFGEYAKSKPQDFESFDQKTDWDRGLQILAILVAAFRAYPGENMPSEGSDKLRVLKALRKLMVARAVLDGRSTFNESDFRFAVRVAHDTVPPYLNRLVAALASTELLPLSEIRRRIGWSLTALNERILQLAHLGFLDVEAPHSSVHGRFCLKDEVLGVLSELGYLPASLYPQAARKE